MKNSLAKIAVLVSGGGTNLQALIDAEKSGIIKSGKIEIVISNNSEAYPLHVATSTRRSFRPFAERVFTACTCTRLCLNTG